MTVDSQTICQTWYDKFCDTSDLAVFYDHEKDGNGEHILLSCADGMIDINYTYQSDPGILITSSDDMLMNGIATRLNAWLENFKDTEGYQASEKESWPQLASVLEQFSTCASAAVEKEAQRYEMFTRRRTARQPRLALPPG